MTNEELAQRLTAIEETLAANNIVIRAVDNVSILPELIVDSKKAIFSFILAIKRYDVTAFAKCRSCDYEFEFSFQAKMEDQDGLERVIQCPRCERRFRGRVWHRPPKE